MEKASFSLEKYVFKKVLIDLDYYKSKELFVNFAPSGIFNKKNSTFNLTFNFSAYTSKEGGEKPFVSISCVGEFKFTNVKSLEDIPTYFYRNSIAILFPYLRAFVSMVTNQANIPPLILPTMNLTSLEKPLRENTSKN